MSPGKSTLRVLKVSVFSLSMLPALFLLLAAFGIAGYTLGANPIETLLHEAGQWGLRFLLLTLSITPLRRLTGFNWLIRFRRMLGLFSFFYILSHFLIYALLDQRLDLTAVVADIIERPYITLGIAGLLLLIPLALTSTKSMMRRLGRHWQRLHRLVYPAAILGVWHFWWQVKQDIREPLVYALILGVLLGWRLVSSLKKRRQTIENVRRPG